MKKLILLLIYFLLATPVLKAQNQENKFLIEEYIQNSEKQKATGMTMICAGIVAFGVGILIANDAAWDDPAFGTGIYLALGGGASTLIGIPILISSGVKARKAAELSLQATRIQNPLILGHQSKVFPSIGISIPLSHK